MQLLQLRFAGDGSEPAHAVDARGPRRSADEELLSDREVEVLKEAWKLATRIRNGLALARARTIDLLPVDRGELEAVARLVGMPAGWAATSRSTTSPRPDALGACSSAASTRTSGRSP